KQRATCRNSSRTVKSCVMRFSSSDSDPSALIGTARQLLGKPDPTTRGLWPRSAALLARQSLEAALDALWRLRAPGVEECSMHAQLLALPSYLPKGGELAKRVAYAWSGLSRATHHHAYE